MADLSSAWFSAYEEIEEAIRGLPIPPEDSEVSFQGIGKSIELLRSFEPSGEGSGESSEEGLSPEGGDFDGPDDDGGNPGPNGGDEIFDQGSGDVASRYIVCGVSSGSCPVRSRGSRAETAAAPAFERPRVGIPSGEFIHTDCGPSRLKRDYIIDTMVGLGIDERVTASLPNSSRRPWDAPEGYVCVYECFFTKCGLWLPLPKFLTDYCARRRIAFAQLSDASIRNAVGLVILGVRAGIEIDVDVLEGMTDFSVRKDGLCILLSKPGRKITAVVTRKVNDWRSRYFFLRIDEHSAEDPCASDMSKWNFAPDCPPKLTSGSRSPELEAKLERLRGCGTIWWPSVLDHLKTCRFLRFPFARAP